MAFQTVEDAILDKWAETTGLLARVPTNQTFIDETPLLNEDHTEELDRLSVEVREQSIPTIKRANDGTECHTKMVSITVLADTREECEEIRWKVYTIFNRLGGPGTWTWARGAILDMKPAGGQSVTDTDGSWKCGWTFKTLYTVTS